VIRTKLSPFIRTTGIAFNKDNPAVFFLKSLISGILADGVDLGNMHLPIANTKKEKKMKTVLNNGFPGF